MLWYVMVPIGVGSCVVATVREPNRPVASVVAFA